MRLNRAVVFFAFAYHGLQPDCLAFFVFAYHGLQPVLPSMSDRRARCNQAPTEVILPFPRGSLSVFLTTKAQAEDLLFYAHVQRSTGKTVRAAGNAAAPIPHVNYPQAVEHFQCPIYYNGDTRSHGICAFYEFCLTLAPDYAAVIIHCAQGFHRGPLLLAALAKCAGLEKTEVLWMLAEKRHIDPCHLMYGYSRDPDLELLRPRLAARMAEERIQNLIEAHSFVDEICGPELVEDRRRQLAGT